MRRLIVHLERHARADLVQRLVALELITKRQLLGLLLLLLHHPGAAVLSVAHLPSNHHLVVLHCLETEVHVLSAHSFPIELLILIGLGHHLIGRLLHIHLELRIE